MTQPKSEVADHPFEVPERGADAAAPEELYLEVTNRCNLRCTTCPQYFGMEERFHTLTWERFVEITDQFSRLRRVVLHGIGEPLLNPELGRMIRHLKARGAYVLFNTNGLLLRGKKARDLGRTPLARILAYAATGVDPKVMGIGPVPAVRQVLDRAGLAIGDIDLFELNEAFAAQSLAVTRELAIDPAKVNVNGGAIALGHPIGASGARVLTTLVYALRARKQKYGVASLCIGGGMGIAMAIQNVQFGIGN